MKKIAFFLFIILSSWSCQKSNAIDPDSDWIRLEIPEGREAYAIAGSLDETLLVTTYTKAYYTTDRGKTWHEAKDFHGPVPGLLSRNDTTFAFIGSGQDQEGNPRASVPQYLTLDYGKSWQYHYKSFDIPIGLVEATSGITYRLRQQTTAVHPGSASFYINPTEIIKKDASGTLLEMDFPFIHQLNNLYLDSRNRLYVAASNGTYKPETNSFKSPGRKAAAIVYVSKSPLP